MARHGVRLFTMLVLFCACLFSASRASAQIASNKSQSWKTESQALGELTVQIDQLLITQSGQTPATPAYLNTESHIVYYKMIHALIAQGKTVPEAISLALGYADTTWLGTDDSSTVQAARTQWYNDALAFLTN